jgi:hypothetical protein
MHDLTIGNKPDTPVNMEVCKEVARPSAQIGDDLTTKSRETLAANAMAKVGHCPTSNPALPAQPFPRS